MDSEKIDYEELTLTVTLLVVIFTVLYGVNNYFYNNIIDLKSSSVIVAIYFLVAVLFFEFFFLFSFLLTKGYLASFPEDQLLKLREINKNLHRISFGVPIFILITFILFIPYFYYVVILHPQLSETIKSSILILIFIFATLISAQILFDLRFTFNFAYLKWGSVKVFYDILYRQNHVEWSKSIIFGFLAFILELFCLAIIMIGLVFAPTFLLRGAYSIDITNQANSDTMSIVISDTGLPSTRCFVHLSNINGTNTQLRHKFDDIIMVEPELTTSGYMYGQKIEGIWYLFINTSNIPSGYYLIEADVEYFNIHDWLRARKYDSELFYLN